MSPRRRKDSIPDDQYSNIGTFSFGTADTTPARSTAGEADIDSLYQDDPERPFKRRATEGSRRSSQVTELSLRPPSPASVVSVGPLYNFHDEPDWDVSLKDSAASSSRRSSWMRDVEASNESRRGSVSSGGSRRKRKSRSVDPSCPGEDENMGSRTSTPTEARTPTQSTFSTEAFGRADVRPRRESRRQSGASSARMRRRSSSTGHSIRSERRSSDVGSTGKRRSMDVGRISLRDAPVGVAPLNLGEGSSGGADTWEGINLDDILDVKPNAIKQYLRIGFHRGKRGEEFEDHLSEINQADPWAISKDKASDKWTSGVLGSSYQIIRPALEGNQQSRTEAHPSRSRYDPLTAPNLPRRDALKDVHLRRTDVQQDQPPFSDIRIHHHAAVDGFSITRTFKHDHVTHMERAILLATKKSLRQYTNTRTTNSLQSHGLLDDEKDRKHKDRRDDTMQSAVESSAARPSGGNRLPQEIYSPPRPSTADSIDSTAVSSTVANVSDTSFSVTLGEMTPVTPDAFSSNVRQNNPEPETLPSAQPSGSSIRKMFSFFKSSSPEATRPETKKPQSTEERAAEKRRAEEFARSFQGSFVQSGLLPRMPIKPRKAKNYHEPCNALRAVEPDQYCMVLPLWGDGPRRKHRSHAHSRSLTPDIPVESRKFLLVYLLPIPAPPNQALPDFTERQLPSQAYRHGFKAHGRILHYEQLSTSGIRLPIHGLPVRTTPAELLLPPMSSSLDDDTEDPIMATITKKKPSHSMVMLHFEAFVKFGLAIVDHAISDDQPSFFPERVYLTELGWAVTEMIWSGCFALLNFGS